MSHASGNFCNLLTRRSSNWSPRSTSSAPCAVPVFLLERSPSREAGRGRTSRPTIAGEYAGIPPPFTFTATSSVRCTLRNEDGCWRLASGSSRVAPNLGLATTTSRSSWPSPPGKGNQAWRKLRKELARISPLLLALEQFSRVWPLVRDVRIGDWRMPGNVKGDRSVRGLAQRPLGNHAGGFRSRSAAWYNRPGCFVVWF